MSDVSTFFEQFEMTCVSNDTLDEALSASPSDIDILFLWGRDYAEPALAIRFGLHGVPTFIVFHRGRKLGRISPFPGADPFIATINQQLAKLAN